MKKQNKLHRFWPKRKFPLKIFKNQCHFWIQHQKLPQSAKFHWNPMIIEKMDQICPIFGPKKGVYGKNFQKSMSFLNSAPKITYTYKISLKFIDYWRNGPNFPDLGPKRAFPVNIFKNQCHFWIQHQKLPTHAKFHWNPMIIKETD